VIHPPAILGLLGGGQLGLFFVRAAHTLGYPVWVVDPDPGSPAGREADRHLAAAYDDPSALDTLAGACAAVTTEFENVPAASLERLATRVRVAPSASAVAICQNRIAEKSFLREHGLPHGPFAVIRSAADVKSAADKLFPGVLKVARFGYDGKGQARVGSRTAAEQALQSFRGEACVLEALLPLDREVSVVMARGADGATAIFPLSENRHRRGILDTSIVPARISTALADKARHCAQTIAGQLDYVGTLGVEFFVSRGTLLVNEMAPRPHNSGHWTLDAARTSQYEQQVRAVCGLPLGGPAATSAAVMVNLLGEQWFADGKLREPDWAALTKLPGMNLHLYGKHGARPGRKMGHFTVTGGPLPALLATARAGRAALNMEDDDA
jgi:5-(carboxyamino)imidazole ribonucleotide synthase